LVKYFTTLAARWRKNIEKMKTIERTITTNGSLKGNGCTGQNLVTGSRQHTLERLTLSSLSIVPLEPPAPAARAELGF